MGAIAQKQTRRLKPGEAAADGFFVGSVGALGERVRPGVDRRNLVEPSGKISSSMNEMPRETILHSSRNELIDS
jgi:hypothetical protein